KLNCVSVLVWFEIRRCYVERPASAPHPTQSINLLSPQLHSFWTTPSAMKTPLQKARLNQLRTRNCIVRRRRENLLWSHLLCGCLVIEQPVESTRNRTTLLTQLPSDLCTSSRASRLLGLCRRRSSY